MPTTLSRALKAARILKAYDEDDISSSCVDMLADIRHLCHAHGFSFDEMLKTADMHFKAENSEVDYA